MWFRQNKLLVGTMLVVLMLLLSSLSISGCARTGAVPRGWSGVAVAENTLFLGTMEGKVVALNASSGARLWPQDFTLETQAATGGFGCEAPSTTGKLIALNISDGSRLWEVSIETSKPAAGGFGCAPASTGLVIYGNPAVDGDLVYIGGYNGKVYAISSSTRLSKEKYLDENDPQPIIGGAVVSQGKLYIGSSDGKVYALGTTSLDNEWDSPFETRDKIWASPAIDEGTLYIGSFDQKLYALNAADGSKRWEFKTEGAIVSTPLIYNDTVYIGSFDRYFYAIDATDGRLRWKFMGTNWFWAKAVAHNNIIYAPCLDGKVYVLDAESGREVVDAIDLGSPVSSSPVLVDDLLIIASEEGKLYSLDTINNQVKQLADLAVRVYAPLSASDGMVYIHTEKNTLHAMDVQTGAEREFNIK